MQTIWNDLKFALRQLVRAPGFALTAILTLALGIGANTAIFSLLDQALLRSLPVRDPASLVVFEDSSPTWRGSISVSGGTVEDYFTYPSYLQLRDHAQGLSGLLATTGSPVSLTRNNASQFVAAEIVSGNYFDVLGVAPALGRTLQVADDGQPNANPVAVLSYDFWRDKLGGDPSVVGSIVSINGHPFQVVGVAAPHFTSAIWGQTTGIFVPLAMLQQAMSRDDATNGGRFLDHSYKWLSMLGRLKPGVTAAQVQAQNAPLWHALRASDLGLLGTQSARFQKGYLDSTLRVLPGARGFSFNRTDLKKPFLAIMAMALLVLLIASVNVASLLMVRAAGRIREFSLRAALGASSAQIVSQLLLEGVVIGICGGIVGVLLAPFALVVLVGRLADTDGNTAFSATIDHRVLFFNFAVAVGVSLLFSLVPALQLRRPNLSSTLRESTGTGSGGLLQLRRIIVCLQIGLSVVLLVGSGLFIRTMQHLRAVDVGFNTQHLLSFNIDPRASGYSDAATPALEQRILDRLAALPGVQAATATDDPELVGSSSLYGVTLTGYEKPQDDSYQVIGSAITPSYLSTLQIPLIAGRNLAETDTLDHPLVALVNQTFVKHFCNGVPSSCIGRRIGTGSVRPATAKQMEIIGVIRDTRHRGVRAEIAATMYRPLKQVTDVSQIYFNLRTTSDPAQQFNFVRNTIHQLDPSLAVGSLITMDQQIDDNLRNERMITLLAISFGMLATLLAGVGLYGVLAYSTAQRTREIGIRMALGSTRLAVSSLIVADVLRLAAIGLVVALPVAFGLSRLLRSQLFGVTAADPIILLSVTGLIVCVALFSAFLPARKAASIEPVKALRTE